MDDYTNEDSEFDELEQYLIDNPTTDEEENAPIAINEEERPEELSPSFISRDRTVWHNEPPPINGLLDDRN